MSGNGREAAATPVASRWWAPWALPVTAPPVRDALLEVGTDGRIVALQGSTARHEAAAAGAVILDGCILAPGFVNAHSHIEYASYDAVVDGLDFASWIADHMARKRRLAPEHMRAVAELGAWQSLAGGITCTADASYSGDAAHAMCAAGLRGRVYLEVFSSQDDEAALEEVLARLDALPDGGGIVERGISPHAPYTVSERLYRLVAATGMRWVTHLLESPAEVQCVLTGTGPLAATLRRAGFPPPEWGRSPLSVLRDVLGPSALGVHLVQATPEDLEVLASTGTPVAHCPRSNARLGCGVLDLSAVDRAGVTVALGTDSPASAGPLDMFAEMRAAIELHRAASRDASAPDARRVLEMATVDAAAAIGIDDVGSITPGGWADIVAVAAGPTSDPAATYVLSGSPSLVQLVLVGGREVLGRDRSSLEQAHERATAARELLALPVSGGR